MKYRIHSKKFFSKRLGLSLITSVFFLAPNYVLAEKINSFYWSGSLAAVCNLYTSGKISDIDAKSYIRRVFSYIDEMPNEQKNIVYDWFNELNSGKCRRLGV